MSELEPNEGTRVKGRNVIQYASEQINALDSRSTMEGIKTIVAADRKIREAVLAHMAEQDRVVDSRSSDKNPTVTGAEIEKALQDGEYREMLDER